MSLVRKLFLQFDLFSALPTLRARGETDTMNICGGIVSFLLLMFFTYVFIITFVNMITFKSMEVVERQEKFKKGLGEINDILLSVGVTNANYNRDIYPYARLSMYIIKQRTDQFGFKTQTASPIKLQVCTIDHFSSFGNQSEDIFFQYLFEDNLCVVPGQNLTVKNSFSNNYNQFIVITMDRCTFQENCIENAQQDFKLFQPSYLQFYRFFSVDLYLFDKGFTPSSEIPTFQKITQFQGAFSTNQGSQILIQLSKFSIETDHGILPIEDIKTEEGYYVHPFSFTTIYESRQPHAYISFLLVFSDEHKTIKRVVGKFDEILSYAGGLFSIVIAFLGFFLLSFNEYRYQIMVAEGAFNYNDDGKKFKEQDFTFMKYIKYSFYDWVQLIGCCELEWEDCKQISGTRQEANNQLDVSLLFKKIQHLERSIEYLISQKEEICLYLTEPPSLNEVKRKRKLAEYYDKIIQGNAAMTVQDIKIKDDLQKILHLGLQLSINLPHQRSEASMKSNSRFKQQIDISRKDILQIALDHLNETDKIEDNERLDEQDLALQKQMAQCFFRMKDKQRARIQQKIPIKILNRLKNRLDEKNSKEKVEITFE